MSLINRFSLENGLRVVHELDTSTQMVTLNVLYLVGSRDEDEQHTGFAHLFEHLMFEGSINIPDYDTPLQMACGDNNAFTTSDYTNYYLTVPAANVETGFWLESDRMTGLAFTPQSLEVQRKVVMEEFKQHYITPPYGDIQHLMSALAYQVHPYRWPTLGTGAHRPSDDGRSEGILFPFLRSQQRRTFCGRQHHIRGNKTAY